MATFSNRFNAPKTLVNLLERDDYTRGHARISVTQLIDAPRIRLLREKHDADIVIDVSDSLWALVGRALHKVAETGADEEHLAEERLYDQVLGWVISGGVDVQRISEGSAIIGDYKLCAAYALRHEKPEWERQLNIYAWLVRKAKGLVAERLEVYAVVRDWNRREAARDRSYPQAPIQVVPVRLWTPDVQEQYVLDRVRVHQQAETAAELGGDLPECSDQERWMRGSTFAVMKPGAKRAIKLCGTREEAGAVCGKNPGTFVTERKADPVRCSGDFCRVSKWCSQYAEWGRGDTDTAQIDLIDYIANLPVQG